MEDNPANMKNINTINGEVDWAKMNYLIEVMIDEGWTEIDVDELLGSSLEEASRFIPKGSRIRYITDNKYRSGGFLVKMDEGNGRYLLIRGFTGRIFPCQLGRVQRMWFTPRGRD